MRRSLRLFTEQVAVRSRSGQRQDKDIIFHTVDQQPVRENMAFPVSHPIAGQGMVLVLFRKRFSHRQQGDHVFQQFDIQPTLHGELEILFKKGRGLDRVLRLSHAFRSAKSSSKSLYPLTDGSFAILSASNIAAIVSLLG